MHRSACAVHIRCIWSLDALGYIPASEKMQPLGKSYPVLRDLPGLCSKENTYGVPTHTAICILILGLKDQEWTVEKHTETA